MPAFKNEVHRRKWIASIRRAFAKKRAAKAASKKDALAAGAELGKKPNEFDRAKQKYVAKHGGVAGLNGSFDTILSALRVDRVRADDQVTRLDAAIKALEAIRPAH